MIVSNFVIDEINKHYKISAYLADKGIQPRRQSGDKLIYHCPLPGHSEDRTPSFSVYDKGDHEDFHCYGCKSGGNIIQLVSEMENLSFRDTISKLSSELNIDISDVIDSIVREMITITGGVEDSKESVLQMVMYISSVCNDYLKKINLDPSEIEICDKLFALCDNMMKSRDRVSLEQTIELLPGHLGRRYNMWAEKQEKLEHERIMSWKT